MRLHRRLQASEGLEAEPVHAGVEMDRAGTGLAATGGEGGPALELLFAADRGREAMLDIVRRIGPALEAVEHIDRGLRRQHAPRRDPFAEMGDEEDARARGPQRRRSFGDADPVSIGLDDGGATPRRRAARKVAPVVGQRGKVDPQAPRRGDRSHDVHHSRTFSITAVVGVSNPGCASTSRRAKPQRSNSRSFSGSSSRVLSVILLAPRRLASVSQAAISERTNPRPRAPGATDTRATWSASSFEAPQRRRDERAALEDAESAARRDFGCDRRAGFEKGRRWRGGLPVLRGESRPDEFGRLACVGVRQRAKDKLGRRFGVLGDWIANLHARMYKTVARLEGKGGKFPQRLASFVDEV